MSFTRHHYTTHADKTNDFLLGFVGWSLLNVTFGSALMLGPSPINYSGQQHTIVVFFVAALVFVSWMLNIGFLVYFGFTRYWIALGILVASVSYTHLRAHETPEHLVCRLLLEKKKTY